MEKSQTRTQCRKAKHAHSGGKPNTHKVEKSQTHTRWRKTKHTHTVEKNQTHTQWRKADLRGAWVAASTDTASQPTRGCSRGALMHRVRRWVLMQSTTKFSDAKLCQCLKVMWLHIPQNTQRQCSYQCDFRDLCEIVDIIAVTQQSKWKGFFLDFIILVLYER